MKNYRRVLFTALGIYLAISIAGVFLYEHCFRTDAALDTSTSVDIKSLVAEVKRQLIELDEERQSTNGLALFQLDYFELELGFVVKNNVKIDSVGSFKLIALEVSAGLETQNIQKLKIKWSAVMGPAVTERGNDLDLNKF